MLFQYVTYYSISILYILFQEPYYIKNLLFPYFRDKIFLLTHDNLIKRKRIENKPQDKLYYKQYNVTNKFEKKKEQKYFILYK